jgi:hypothetical protein
MQLARSPAILILNKTAYFYSSYFSLNLVISSVITELILFGWLSTGRFDRPDSDTTIAIASRSAKIAMSQNKSTTAATEEVALNARLPITNYPLFSL